jgi:hypothetical protein
MGQTRRPGRCQRLLATPVPAHVEHLPLLLEHWLHRARPNDL